MLHETFARALGPSLSAFLRAYVIVNLVSVEQLAFAEFSRSLPSPTILIKLGMTGFDNNAIFEMNPSLVFPLVELLLGSPSPGKAPPDREITEIERAVLDGVLRVVLKDMRESWRNYVPRMDFSIEGFETEPQLLQILSPNEAVVAISIEIRAGEICGMLNIGIPSIIIKMLGQQLEQHGARRAELSDAETARILRLVAPAALRVDTRMLGQRLTVRDLLAVQAGDVLTFDYPVERPVHVTLNGRPKFSGRVIAVGRKRSIMLDDLAALDRA
jgi:flagellar motor switch protein FliM